MHVLISGAGIAGPTLAFWLAKAGIRSTIVEKAKALLAQGQNIDIQRTAVSIFQRMGLLDEVRKHNTKEKGAQFYDGSGRIYAKFPITAENTMSLTSEYEILRGDLATILYEATVQNPLVTYRFGTTVVKVLANNANMVEVELNDGKFEQYDLLVAADGQWSKLRQQCFPAEDVKAIDTGMYSAWWTQSRIPSDTDHWNIYLGPHGKNMSMRPDPYGTVRTLISYMPQTEEQKRQWQNASRADTQTKFDLLTREFEGEGWQAKRLLEGMMEAPDFYFYSLQQIKLAKWSQGRVICLGDAAYAPTPLTGMGTSLAIDGAYTLAGELSKLKQGDSIYAALESYERVFRPFVEETQHIPKFVPGIVHPSTTFKLWILQRSIWAFAIVFSALKKVSWINRRLNKAEDDDFVLPHYPAFESVKQKLES